jgi:hypothetical protein
MAEIIKTNWFRPMREDLTQFLREEMNRKGGTMEPHNTEAWANALLRDALNSSASDIHLAPQSDGVQLRLRVDGTLFDTLRLTTAQGDRMIRHLKTMADIDPFTTFKPQVARRTYQVDGRDVDLRLACVPSICGDTLTIRILESDRLEQRIDQLGLSDEVSLPAGMYVGQQAEARWTCPVSCPIQSPGLFAANPRHRMSRYHTSGSPSTSRQLCPAARDSSSDCCSPDSPSVHSVYWRSAIACYARVVSTTLSPPVPPWYVIWNW